MKPRALCLLSLIAAGLTACAGVAQAAEIPFLAGRVNDEAGLLSGETVQRLSTLLKTHEDSTSNQVVVLVVASLDGQEIEEYSMKVVESWKLGQRGKDNGVLLLVSRDDRRVRIEVGRGLEGPLPDITCGSIIRKEILPKFKQGDYDGGVTAGVEAILSAIAGSYQADTGSSTPAGDIGGIIIASLIFFVVVGVFTIILILSPGGGQMWFLYLFLIPFWAAFPMALYGMTVGAIMLGSYLVGVPVLRALIRSTPAGRKAVSNFGGKSSFSVGGWSSSSGSGWSGSSSSSSSFSGGGGSFSGGGSSGSW